jgi:hypothetical protein
MLYGILNIPHSYYVIYMNKQLVFGVIAVVFATALISSLVVDQASASWNKNNQKSSSHSNRGHDGSGQGGSGQIIAQSCTQDQSSSVLTAGANSPVSNSGNNEAVCTNTNNGGNAASQ